MLCALKRVKGPHLQTQWGLIWGLFEKDPVNIYCIIILPYYYLTILPYYYIIILIYCHTITMSVCWATLGDGAQHLRASGSMVQRKSTGGARPERITTFFRPVAATGHESLEAGKGGGAAQPAADRGATSDDERMAASAVSMEDCGDDEQGTHDGDEDRSAALLAEEHRGRGDSDCVDKTAAAAQGKGKPEGDKGDNCPVSTPMSLCGAGGAGQPATPTDAERGKKRKAEDTYCCSQGQDGRVSEGSLIRAPEGAVDDAVADQHIWICDELSDVVEDIMCRCWPWPLLFFPPPLPLAVAAALALAPCPRSCCCCWLPAACASPCHRTCNPLAASPLAVLWALARWLCLVL